MTTHRTVFPVMGTMATLAIAGSVEPVLAARAATVCRASLEADDHRFSHYTQASEIMRWMRHDPVSDDARRDIEYVLDQCLLLQVASNGVFSITNPITGFIDTAGFVKGYAMRKAASAVRAVGVHDFSLNVGGDVVCHGQPSADRPWRIAVTDPFRAKGIAALLEVADAAVATSGTVERGDHIWNRDPARPLRSFTVTGPDIALADAYATIGFAMGEGGIAWVNAHEGYHSLAIRADGSCVGDAPLVSVA